MLFRHHSIHCFSPSAKQRPSLSISSQRRRCPLALAIAIAGSTLVSLPAGAAVLGFTSPGGPDTGVWDAVEPPSDNRSIINLGPTLISTNESWDGSCTITGELEVTSSSAVEGEDFVIHGPLSFSLTTQPDEDNPSRFKPVSSEILFEVMSDQAVEEDESIGIDFVNLAGTCNGENVTSDIDKVGYWYYGGRVTIHDTFNTDEDGDGVGAAWDAFPDNPAASLDADGDGLPDAWNASCDAECQSESGLQLDQHLDDRDNDGIKDLEDTDDNGDGELDADSDSNGLIEIRNLEQLNAMRYELAGRGRRMSQGGELDTSGCPSQRPDGSLSNGCWGYELVTDLDFEVDEHNIVDSRGYAYETHGWEPVGAEDTPFTAVFEGNGHSVTNLSVGGGWEDAGLFGSIEHAKVRNVGLLGAEVDTSSGVSGGLVGTARDTEISFIIVQAAVSSDHENGWSSMSGGLAGRLYGTTVSNSYVMGSVSSRRAAGLVGNAYASLIRDSASTSTLIDLDETNYYPASGLAASASSVKISRSYATGDGPRIGRRSLVTDPFCPEETEDTRCFNDTLYSDWDEIVDDQSSSAWDLGTSQQLPGILLNSVVYRDSDSDGIPDHEDAFPYQFAASKDADRDGLPDEWHERCDEECQADSPLTLDSSLNDTDNDGVSNEEDTDIDGDGVPNDEDAFPANPAASKDSDGDGRPGEWHADCDQECRAESGLTLDPDRDGDGVANEDDAYPGEADRWDDTTAPEMVEVPEGSQLAATGDMTMVELDVASALAYDDFDSTLDYQVELDGERLTINQDGEVSLPSGRLTLNWVAVDDAGNRSEPMPQQVDVYPQVSFAEAESITGESTQVGIPVSFSGDSPQYPITIQFSWDEENSDAGREDVRASEGDETDLKSMSLTIESADDLEAAQLELFTIGDDMMEPDELFIVRIESVKAGADGALDLNVAEDHSVYRLTITDSNLPPELEIEARQEGEATTEIDPNSGEVTLTAKVTDPNGADSHSFQWYTDGLTVSVGDQASFTFDPSTVASGTYSLSAIASDNGNPILSSDEVSFEFEIVDASTDASGSLEEEEGRSDGDTEASRPSDSGGSQGGGTAGFWLLSALWLARRSAFFLKKEPSA